MTVGPLFSVRQTNQVKKSIALLEKTDSWSDITSEMLSHFGTIDFDQDSLTALTDKMEPERERDGRDCYAEIWMTGAKNRRLPCLRVQYVRKGYPYVLTSARVFGTWREMVEFLKEFHH